MKLIKDNFEEGHVVYLLNSSGKQLHNINQREEKRAHIN